MDDYGLLPCAGCKQAKVLKYGDYCVVCSLEWPENSNYIVVTTKTLDKAIHDSGLTGEYLKAKSDLAFENYQSYVIYCIDGEWKEIVISDKFHVPTVMKNLLAKSQ
jgi:hypothetical protein